MYLKRVVFTLAQRKMRLHGYAIKLKNVMEEDSLSRFLEAQQYSYDVALNEIRSGKKTSHWMWYIFPQLRGLGKSSMAIRYGITSLDEARRYLAHPILEGRLIEICKALLHWKGKTALEIFGKPDDVKLLSCMTLFAAVGGEQTDIFEEVMDAFYDGKRDEQTLKMLAQRNDERV